MRELISILVLASTTFAQAQDFDKQIRSLIVNREKAITQIDKQFLEDFRGIRQAAIQILEQDFEASMKALDLETSNASKAKIQQWKALEPTYATRELYVLEGNYKNGVRPFLVKCTKELWIELGEQDGKMLAHFHTEKNRTPDYTELENLNGNIYRVYDNRLVVKTPSKNSFEPMYKVRKLPGVEIEVPPSKP